MKVPKQPPTVREDEWLTVLSSQDWTMLTEAIAEYESQQRGRYEHWDRLRHRSFPQGVSPHQIWAVIKLRRRWQFQSLPLTDVSGTPFVYLETEPIPERLHDIDFRAGGQIGVPEQVTNPETKNRYLISSLIEEAITSSQLEGATTTRPVAKEMIRSQRPPRDRSEQMILNNFRTMEHIGKLRNESLTADLVFEIHQRVTMSAFDDPTAAGRIRRDDEYKVVGDPMGFVEYHRPPPADQLGQRMEAMCQFANAGTPSRFVHPVIRSMILHFWLAYDHPFVDGNGRTARALFYWSMLHHGYWLCEFISISEIIRKSPAGYGRAFLLTESDENDLTYFLLYHVEVIRRAVDELHTYVKLKTGELRALEQEMAGVAELNHRQRALVAHALRHSGFRYNIESHRHSHAVVYQTARTDLLDLSRRGLFQKRKLGRTWYFTPVIDIEQRLQGLSQAQSRERISD